MNLSDKKKQAIAEVFAKYPGYYNDFKKALEYRGMSFDVDEYLPVDWSLEGEEATKSALESLTLGLYDPGERDPRVGDIDILGMNLSPSGMAGAVAGALPTALAGGYGGAAAAARMGAGAVGKTVGRVVGGEATPGFIEGLIKSGGELDEALKMAGIWTATGLMLEGTGRLAIKALRKRKDGKKLTSDETLALDEYNRVAGNEGLVPVRTGDPYNWGITPEEISTSLVPRRSTLPAGRTSSALQEAGPSTVARAEDVRRETPNVGSPEIETTSLAEPFQPMLKGQVQEQAYEELHRFTSQVSDLAQDTFNRLSLRVDSLDQATVQLGGGIDDLINSIPHITPERQVELREQMAEVWRSLLIAIDEGKLDHQSANILFRSVGDGSIGSEDVLEELGKRRPARKIPLLGDAEEGTEKLWREGFGKDAPEIRGGVDLPEPPATGADAGPATETQISRIHEITQLLKREGDEFAMPGPDEVRGYNMRDARRIEVQAKSRLSFIRGRKRNQALHNLQQEAADPDGTKRAWVDNPPSDMDEAQKAVHRELKRKQKLGRVVYDDAEVLKEPGLPYYLGIVPNISRWGLGSNPVTKAIVEKSMHMFEDIGRQKAAFWKRYQAAVEPLEATRMDRVSAATGRQEAREALEEEARLKGLLVQALDGRDTNRILSEHGELVPIYNELRTMFDELADNIDLPRSERISAYFPHIFGDDTALWRAMRMSNDLGGRARFAAKYLPEEIANEIPEGRFFGSLIERRGTDAAYSEDLDAVMYAYMHGAIETPRFSTFLRDANEALTKLPEGQMRQSFADWSNYVVGRPSEWKKAQARWWQQNETFNRWVDNAVEWLGDSETKGLLERSRKGMLSPDEEKLALDYFDKLLTDANRFTKEGKIKGRDVKQYRAHLALLVDNMRASLASPTARPVVLEKLYQLMVINKLGFSFSHMMTNFTQTMTNTLPKVGLRYVTKGMQRYSGDKANQFSNGRTVEEVLEESGVLADIPEYREFFGGRKHGFLADLDKVALSPARFSEDFNRSVALLGRYEQAIDEGMDHAAALIDARNLVRETQFVFNRAGTMPLFRNPGIRFLLMFKSYALHQINFSAELLHDAMKGDKEAQAALFKHLLAYATLAGGTAAVSGPAPNLRQQTEHPLIGLVSSESPLDALGGPPSDMLLEMLQGNVTQGLSELTEPSIMRRYGRATESGELSQLLGLKSQ